MKIVDTGLWNGDPYAIIDESGNVIAHSVADSESGIHSQEGLMVITSRIAALEAQNKKLVEALATLEAISINAIEHVALANYPEREKKAIAQVEAYFSRARQAAQ